MQFILYIKQMNYSSTHTEILYCTRRRELPGMRGDVQQLRSEGRFAIKTTKSYYSFICNHFLNYKKFPKFTENNLKDQENYLWNHLKKIPGQEKRKKHLRNDCKKLIINFKTNPKPTIIILINCYTQKNLH